LVVIANITLAPSALVAGVTMFGTVIVGGVLITVTVNDPAAIAFCESLVKQLTVTVPIGKKPPVM
jgi:hypothetical protein